ncbi:MAG TPA: MaoC family dehydratase N-terminal domain-containing protein [Intrasporangium sp.]|uniref:FAS1-like dehydratase domain-containing protein n=1 Tax=Intrasporangium sp. TaxID=1925024 RepID=UPI002D7870BC|nr:MaoC family dehydratase N-terminal domain-containing protein [Intrasporangium sp.]HET7399105.1 MaoC family dehydratase N-terminal domain-containing protein [Intrasporangium sp.]
MGATHQQRVQRDLVGTVIDEVSFEVERGKIREFARATFTTDPVHTDRAAAAATGAKDVLATATHVVVAGHHRDQRAFVDRLGLALERVVVGGVRWTYARALEAGDSLHGVRRVTGDVERESSRGGRMRVITLETEYVDAAGRPSVHVEETIIERGASG